MKNEQFLNEIAMMIDDTDDYMIAIVNCDKECIEEAYMSAINHLNGLFFYLITYGETKLFAYGDTIDLWINAYISYRDFWDQVVLSDIETLATDHEYETGEKVISDLSKYTHQLLHEIVDDLAVHGTYVEDTPVH